MPVLKFSSNIVWFAIYMLLVPGTVLARLAMFPVIVKGQREAAKLNNVLPEMTKLTEKMNEAKQSGNKYECTSPAVRLSALQSFLSF